MKIIALIFFLAWFNAFAVGYYVGAVRRVSWEFRALVLSAGLAAGIVALYISLITRTA
jgi:hypothetical protein